jgi:hypothetical protein
MLISYLLNPYKFILLFISKMNFKSGYLLLVLLLLVSFIMIVVGFVKDINVLLSLGFTVMGLSIICLIVYKIFLEPVGGLMSVGSKAVEKFINTVDKSVKNTKELTAATKYIGKPVPLMVFDPMPFINFKYDPFFGLEHERPINVD